MWTTPLDVVLCSLLSHALSRDQQTTAGKVMLMGLVECMAALPGLLLPGSRRARGWTTNKPDHFTNKADHQKNLTLKLYRSIVTNKPDHQKNLTLQMYRSSMIKSTNTLQSGQREKIEPMSMMRWSFFFSPFVCFPLLFSFSKLPIKKTISNFQNYRLPTPIFLKTNFFLYLTHENFRLLFARNSIMVLILAPMVSRRVRQEGAEDAKQKVGQCLCEVRK